MTERVKKLLESFPDHGDWLSKLFARKPDWRMETVRKFHSFREKGETFKYLGITMIVTGYYNYDFKDCDWHPCLMADYVDLVGNVQNIFFEEHELDTLVQQNTKKP